MLQTLCLETAKNRLYETMEKTRKFRDLPRNKQLEFHKKELQKDKTGVIDMFFNEHIWKCLEMYSYGKD